MRIIVEGDYEKSKAFESFRCNDCGCEFEADRTEYKKEVEHKRSGYKIYKYTVRDGCPCCRHWCGKTLIEKPEKKLEKKPIYPTWMEWLAANVPGTDADSIYEAVQILNRTHVPADIAQRLGIAPRNS